MLKSQPLSLLLLASGIAFAGSVACSEGGETKTPVILDPTGGAGGAVGVGGTGDGGSGLAPSGGSTATGGTSTGGTGGSTVTGGTGGSTVTGGTGGSTVTGGTGGSGVTGGTGGSGVTGGAGGSGDTGGAAGTGGSGGSGDTGGTAGTGGSGGSGGDPNMIVLFDGSQETFNAWTSVRNGGANPWQRNNDGTMTVRTNTGDIISSQTFQDVFVHVEYVTPRITSACSGQECGNSGVYLKGSYELQILDTFGQQPAADGCGAIYGIAAPLVSACNDQEVWNTYEIEFKANVCTNNQKTANANFVEVKLNDQVVHRNVSVSGTTQAGQPETCQPKGILLQDHSSVLPVSFRNIWVIPRTP